MQWRLIKASTGHLGEWSQSALHVCFTVPCGAEDTAAAQQMLARWGGCGGSGGCSHFLVEIRRRISEPY